ncbi:MAG: signal recognition particle protein [Deltaproteobacteria bacterium]|nr:signal recognition particle protein [Deltaproteobacteria bacterium]MBW1951784.1 signal recognition particle protein [Deltaproteobacteria bacterium]MBW1985649.1 signal recognition particle protein [Deltaproteobacteria bacterium]MBW2134411.1 signal recognition particle protein [Deltaproteobacteria bacterium]
MFDRLSDKLAQVFKKLKGHGKLTEVNIYAALREVRLALLEADVNYKVAKAFIDRVRERALGQEVMASLTPGQQMIKIVHEELIELLGGEAPRLDLSGKPPIALMLVGLQGSGKTTTAAKLGLKLKKQGRQPFLVPADIYRPAAIEQLQKLGAEIGVETYQLRPGQNPVEIAASAMEQAYTQGLDTVLLDTAGRLHIDAPLMAELKDIKAQVGPKEILLVADAMTGQDAVQVGQKFHELLDLTGVILTKIEGDARGGAALSMRAVIDRPIKFLGVGEKLDALEVFHPDRLASRILGMGDVLTLIEKAEEAFDTKQAQELERKLRQETFTLEDFRDQLKQVRKMGSLEQLMNMIPGLNRVKGLKGMQPDEQELVRIEAIINSMTPKERAQYQIIDGSRRRRIAMGSGTTVQEVNRLLKNFAMTQKMMKKMVQAGKKGGKRRFMPFGF